VRSKGGCALPEFYPYIANEAKEMWHKEGGALIDAFEDWVQNKFEGEFVKATFRANA